jgi:hypothetical protein
MHIHIRYPAEGLHRSGGGGGGDDGGGHRLLQQVGQQVGEAAGHAAGLVRLLSGDDDHTTDDHTNSTDDANSYGHRVCQEYTLRYVFVVSMLVMLYLLGVFLATELYMQRLLCKVGSMQYAVCSMQYAVCSMQ